MLARFAALGPVAAGGFELGGTSRLILRLIFRRLAVGRRRRCWGSRDLRRSLRFLLNLRRGRRRRVVRHLRRGSATGALEINSAEDAQNQSEQAPATAGPRSRLGGIAVGGLFRLVQYSKIQTRRPMETLTWLKANADCSAIWSSDFRPVMQKGRAACEGGMRKPAAAYGLLVVAKPIPMGQSDWPLRFDDAPPNFRNGSTPASQQSEGRADSGAPESTYRPVDEPADGGCERLGRQGFGAYEYRGPGLLPQGRRLPVGLPGAYAGAGIHPPDRGPGATPTPTWSTGSPTSFRGFSAAPATARASRPAGAAGSRRSRWRSAG